MRPPREKADPGSYNRLLLSRQGLFETAFSSRLRALSQVCSVSAEDRKLHVPSCCSRIIRLNTLNAGKLFAALTLCEPKLLYFPFFDLLPWTLEEVLSAMHVENVPALLGGRKERNAALRG